MNNSAIYINIPFCNRACNYCHYIKNLYFNYTKIPDNYIELIVKQLKNEIPKYEETQYSLYFGGGTPSLLTDKQLDRIFNTLNDLKINLSERSIELHPKFVNFDISKEYFNRYSFGIQTFNSRILSKLNRDYYDEEDINKLVEKVRSKLDGPKLNIDLIFDESFDLNQCDRLNDIKPESITLYPNTKTRGVLRLLNILNSLEKAKKLLIGYNPLYKSRHIFLKEFETQSEYSKIQYELFGNILGFGHNSISYIDNESFLTLYNKNNIFFKKREDKGDRLLSSIICSLSTGVRYKNISGLFINSAYQYFSTIYDEPVYSKYKNIDEDEIVYLPHINYIPFYEIALSSFDNIYKVNFLSTIGYGDSDFSTLCNVYNDLVLNDVSSSQLLYRKKKKTTNINILIEGIDGSGKDTFTDLFIHELKKLFSYSPKSPISKYGIPDSSKKFGTPSKNFIENLEFSSKAQTIENLRCNYIHCEEYIKKLSGICIVVRGLLTELATCKIAFQKDVTEQEIGAGQVITTWDYLVVIHTEPSIAHKRILTRNIPQTWRESLDNLSFFSNFFLRYNSKLFKNKFILHNSEFNDLKSFAKDLATEIFNQSPSNAND